MKALFLSTSLILLLLVSSCESNPNRSVSPNKPAAGGSADGFMIVDCLLPGQLRKLGQSAKYLTARRPIKTSASDCEIRGGEYVAFDRSNYQTSMKIWMPRAMEGDAEAQYYVGEIYDKGLGLEPDYEQARSWYLKSARQGNTRAQLNLGYLYEAGLGVAVDKNEAMKWYQKASGLSDKQIAYTYTVKTAELVQDNESRLLKAELSNSQNESKRLKSLLDKTHQKVLLTQQKLLLSQSELEKARLEKTRFSQDKQLDELIKSRELQVKQQQQTIHTLEQQYKGEVGELEVKLSETQKRVAQLKEELRKNKSAEANKQLQLLEVQAQLARTEKQLLAIQNRHQSDTQLVNTAQLNQAQQLKVQIEVAQHQLKDVKKNLLNYEQEKQKQYDTIQSLSSENKNYKTLIVQLKQQLSSNNISQNEIRQLNNQLAKKERSAFEIQNKLEDSKKKYQQAEERLNAQEELYQARLKNLESEKKHFETLYADSLKLSQSSQNQINQLIAEKKQQWDEQQLKISALLKEKEQLNQKLQLLQRNMPEITTDEVPVIEIIEPAFVQLRGVPTAMLRSVVKTRPVTGKVTSSVGLLSLTVNDQMSPVDQWGLFNEEITLRQTETPVNIVAVDKRGRKAKIDFVISMSDVKKQIETAMALPKEETGKSQYWKSLQFGQYHAIIIANTDYTSLPILKTPLNDARAIEAILREKYGFKTKILQNATRYEILSLLNDYRSKLTSEDNLLVYYAGHGELDRVNMRGHWLPVDADAENTANWISTVSLTDIFNSMAVKHLMVVADSCYSGAMTRASLARLDTGKTEAEQQQWLKAMLRARSRTILSSGGLKPVLDGGGGKHSVFAKAFIESLESNLNLLEGQRLYRKISSKIVATAADYGVEQVPEYAPIHHAGHEAGEFFFVPRF